MGLTILLTGSTGNLGSYILDQLLIQDNVGQVICLNRSKNADIQQRSAHQERGLSQIFFEGPRVQFIQADYSDQHLGLGRTEYEKLSEKTDILIHNAWPVDFNRSFQSFKPSIDGVAHLIRFCQSPLRRDPANKPTAVKFIFISSIGAASNWASAAPTSRSQVPEAELTDWRVARTGYGQSKLVCERLLCHASIESSIPVAIVRVGQLAGPVEHQLQGKWPEREWIPSIIKSSIMLHALPGTLGPTEIVDWMPADIAARVIVEIVSHPAKDTLLKPRMRSRKRTRASFFHVVNPNHCQWSGLVPTMKRFMPSNVQTVSFIEWVDVLNESVERAGGFEGVDEGFNPAGKLIDFFNNLQDRAIRFPYARAAQLDTVDTVKVSSSLAKSQAVSEEWMSLWMRQWGRTEQDISETA